MMVIGSLATAKTTSSQRKPAETHGGVMVSNAQFQAVTAFALNEGGDLSRLFSVKKMINCNVESGSVFEVKFGGQDSKTGKESYHDNETQFLLASEPAAGTSDLSTIKVSTHSGKKCK